MRVNKMARFLRGTGSKELARQRQRHPNRVHVVRFPCLFVRGNTPERLLKPCHCPLSLPCHPTSKFILEPESSPPLIVHNCQDVLSYRLDIPILYSDRVTVGRALVFFHSLLGVC